MGPTSAQLTAKVGAVACVCWEATSWRIAIAPRTKVPFEDAPADLMKMKDTQALQEAMARELQTDKTAQKLTKNNSEKAFVKTFEMNDKGKGNAKGNGNGKIRRRDDYRWQPYNTQGNWQGSWVSPWKQHFGGYNQYGAFYQQQQQQFQKDKGQRGPSTQVGGPECHGKQDGVISKPSPKWLAEEAKAKRSSFQATLFCDQEEGVAKHLASVLAASTTLSCSVSLMALGHSVADLRKHLQRAVAALACFGLGN